MMQAERFDIGIQTVIGPELDAVLRAFAVDRKRDRFQLDGAYFWRGSVRSALTDESYTFVVHCQASAGNSASSAAATKIVERFAPRVMFLTGIAAGRRGKTRLGDVAVPRTVMDDTLGVETTSGRQRRPKIGPPPYAMLQLLAAFNIDRDRWLAELAKIHPPPKPDDTAKDRAFFKKHVAIEPSVLDTGIYSSDNLLRNAKVLEEAAGVHQMIRIGEMEASGFITACEARFPTVPWLIVRGVSDFGDGAKDDRFHRWAAATAASFLQQFIAEGLDLAPKPASPRPQAVGRETLSKYVERQKKEILESSDPAGKDLTVEGIIGRKGLFIRPPWAAYLGEKAKGELVAAIERALRKGERLLLLGEAGHGKTTVLKRAFIRLVDAFLKTEAAPLPLYTPLKTLSTDAATPLTMRGLHDALVAAVTPFPLPFSDFAAWSAEGRIVLLLDGLDEVSTDATQDAINKRALSEIFKLPAAIACRRSFYETYLAQSPLAELYGRKVELLSFNFERDGKEYIRRYCKRQKLQTAERVIAQIEANAELRDFTQRPLPLLMLTTMLAEDGSGTPSGGWTISALYDRYVERWLRTEAAKIGSCLDGEEKSSYLESVAWGTYFGPPDRSNELTPALQGAIFTREDLKRIVAGRGASDPDKVSSDLRHRSLLAPVGAGALEFIHKSFQEYYVARHIRGSILRDPVTAAGALQMFIPVDVAVFLKDMLRPGVLGANVGRVFEHLTTAYEMTAGDSPASVRIRQHASYYLAAMKTPEAIAYLQKMYASEPNAWVQRGMMIGLAVICGQEEVMDEYLRLLDENATAADINLGYHLAYYRDQQPRLGYTDAGGTACNLTLRALFRHLGNVGYRRSWALDLRTLRQLIETRGPAVVFRDPASSTLFRDWLEKHGELPPTIARERDRLVDTLRQEKIL